MEKTLQQQYQLIKEGKGNKDHFLKVAKYMFPEYITSGNDFASTIHILKSKNLLSEAIGGVITQSPIQPDWFKIFNTKIAEAVGVKNTKEYGDQNEFEKPTPEVAKDLANQFDNSDEKNIDNNNKSKKTWVIRVGSFTEKNNAFLLNKRPILNVNILCPINPIKVAVIKDTA